MSRTIHPPLIMLGLVLAAALTGPAAPPAATSRPAAATTPAAQPPAGPVQADKPPDKHAGRTRVACVGDSITFGSGLKDRTNSNYPRQLGRMLGQAWDVRNFGVGGATLNKRGDRPYWNSPEYRQAISFKPDVAVIMLGTNDVRQHNMGVIGGYKGDLKDLIAQFRQANANVVVYCCFPPPSFNRGFAQDRRLGILSGWIDEVAREAECRM